MPLITFDFHNTLASCDSWFDLEVFTIASRVAEVLRLDAAGDELDAAYRTIRAGVMQTGVEISAVDAVISVLERSDFAVRSEDVAFAVDTLMADSMHDLAPKPGAIETVRFLRSQGYRLGIISSAAHHDFVEWSLDSFDILDQFDFVLTSVKAGFYKSCLEIYEMAMTLVGASPSSSLHIGDSIKWDVETAARAGMRTGWLACDQRHSSNTEPDLRFESLNNAGPIIHDFVRQLP